MKVTEVTGARKWPSEDDTKVVYYTLKLEGVEGAVSVGHKPDRPAPKVGDSYDGWTVETDDQGRKKLKRAAGSGGFNGGGRPRDPAERRSIQAQASQKVAVDVARIALETGKSTAEVLKAVEHATEKLFAQVERLSGGGQ